MFLQKKKKFASWFNVFQISILLSVEKSFSCPKISRCYEDWNSSPKNEKKTWIEINLDTIIKTDRFTIPTTWIYKYKFDDQDYLIKFKARLYVKDDLQKINKNTYVATLTIRIFRFFMIIVNAFDLKTRQYDVLNAFVNNEIDEDIYCIFFDEWNDDLVLLFLLKTFYELKQFFVLWYRQFIDVTAPSDSKVMRLFRTKTHRCRLEIVPKSSRSNRDFDSFLSSFFETARSDVNSKMSIKCRSKMSLRNWYLKHTKNDRLRNWKKSDHTNHVNVK